MQFQDLNRDWLSNAIIAFFLLSRDSSFERDLFTLQNIDPDPKNFLMFQKEKKLPILCRDQTTEKAYVVSLSNFHSFPAKLFPTYYVMTLGLEDRINYLELNSEVQGIMVFRTLSMSLDLPYEYEENVVNFKSENEEEEKWEDFDSQKRRWTNGNEVQTFRDFYRVSRFSQDVINLVIANMNETSGFVIFPQKREILVIEDEKIISKFEAETLMIRKTLTFFGKTDPEKTKEALKTTAEEMIAMKVIFLQAVNEVTAFQFRNELQHEKFLRQCNYFKFVEKDILNELEKENTEEMDRDVREDWVQMALGNMENFIKSFGK